MYRFLEPDGEWLRLANHNKQKIEFRNLPAQLAALARISAIEDLLTPNANGPR